jgi:hypothetical protein
MVVLHKLLTDAHVCHDFPVVALEEKTALISEHARLENEYAGQRGRDFVNRVHYGADYLHSIDQNTFSRNSCSRYAP